MITSITKRDGRIDAFDPQKIQQAIEKSFAASGSRKGKETAHHLTEAVIKALDNDETIPSTPTVEQVQDAVERTLIEQGFVRSAKAYILYRAKRSRVREMNTHLMKTFEDICSMDDTQHPDGLRSDTAMGAMLQFGAEGARQFYEMFILDPQYAEAHQQGDIYIHDLEYYTLTTESTQIDLLHLFDGGFTAGHGKLREPNHIGSYAALCCIAIQANQNDQHGCQSIANFDYGMAPGIRKTYYQRFRENLSRAMEMLLDIDEAMIKANDLLEELHAETKRQPELTADNAFDKALMKKLKTLGCKDAGPRVIEMIRNNAEAETETAARQAMEALVHTLNTIASRAGGQVPDSTLNYGLDTSPEGRMVVRSLLVATEEGLGDGQTPAYPVQVFRVKEGINLAPGDPNYDLLRLAVRVSAKRSLPHFSFIDAPFNLPYYQENQPQTEAAYAGNRTRIMGNAHDNGHETALRRGCLFHTSVNLPRIAIQSKGDMTLFWEELERMLELVAEQLLERFDILARKHKRSYPFLMGQGNWLDSETLAPEDTLHDILKHGTLAIGFTGLAETLTALRGAHHGSDAKSQALGIEIISTIRKFCDETSKKHGMNFTCLATPPEDAATHLMQLDRERFGQLPGITDHAAYTDSFHVPPDCALPVLDQLALEAPYHALTNGGHISIARINTQHEQTPDALENLIRHMQSLGIGYGCIKLAGPANL